MNLRWYIEDGYVGGNSRSHTVEIPDDEIEECETQEELDELVESIVKDEFLQVVSFVYEPIKLKK